MFVIVKFKSVILFLCAVISQCFLVSFPTAAQTPTYFDPEWRISAPDLAGLPRLRFLTSLDFPPFNFADANKKPTGLNVDLARAICVQLDIEAKCEIQALPWDDLENALKANRGEAIIAGTAISTEKRLEFNLSHSYFRFPARFIAKRDTPLNSGDTMHARTREKKVAVVAGSAHAAMLKAYFPDAAQVPLANARTVYDAINNDEADLAFLDGVTSSFWLTSPSAKNCCAFVGGPFYSDLYLGLGMAIVTRKEDEALLQAVNAALKSLEENGKYLEIFQRYFPNSPHGESF